MYHYDKETGVLLSPNSSQNVHTPSVSINAQHAISYLQLICDAQDKSTQCTYNVNRLPCLKKTLNK